MDLDLRPVLRLLAQKSCSITDFSIIKGFLYSLVYLNETLQKLFEFLFVCIFSVLLNFDFLFCASLLETVVNAL